MPYEAPQGRRVNVIGAYFSHGPLAGKFEHESFVKLPERSPSRSSKCKIYARVASRGDLMQYTNLGRSGLKVSRLCLGTMNFGPQTSEEDSFKIMVRALEHGINFWDSANDYGGVRPLTIGGVALRATHESRCEG